jgi:predicted porin
LKKVRAIGTTTSASLIAVALVIAPAFATSTQRTKGNRPAASGSARPVGAFTPAVSDPRLAAALARRGTSLGSDFRFTPATAGRERQRGIQVAIRGQSSSTAAAQREAGPTSASAVTAITPSSYNLGVSLGWRRFAITGDVAQADSGLIAGTRESAEVGMSYRATRRLTGRVAVAAERTEGAQRILAEDQAYQLDVGGAFSIARNVDVTAGARYRIARDRLEPLAPIGRRDSQAVYVGTAFRF